MKSVPFGDNSLSGASAIVKELKSNLITLFSTKVFRFARPTDGIVTLSGSEANELAILLAKRTTKQKMVIATNLAHSSIGNACRKLEMKLVTIDVEPYTWQVNPEKMLKLLKKYGKQVAMISATYGTTILGSTENFIQDPTIQSWCAKHGIWLHIDGAYGGSYLNLAHKITPAWKKVFRAANSITVDPHKIIGMMGCGLLLLPHQIDKKIFGKEADYFKGNLTALGTSRTSWGAATAWHTFESIKFSGMKRWARSCYQKANSVGKKLQKVGFTLTSPIQSGVVSVSLSGKKEYESLAAFMKKCGILASPLIIHGKKYEQRGVRLVINPSPKMQSPKTLNIFVNALRDWKKTQ